MNRMAIFAAFEADMQVALSLLKLKKAVIDSTETKKVNNLFACEIFSRKTKKEVQAILSARFGRAIQVK